MSLHVTARSRRDRRLWRERLRSRDQSLPVLTLCREFMFSSSNNSRRTIWAIGVITSGLLAALYLTNSNWFYTKPGWIDAWYFVGYGLYYDNPLFLNDYYKGSRLPWILYQFLFRHLLSPIPAEIVIQFSLYISAAVLAFVVCARLLSRTAATIIGVFVAAFTLLHANGGADYQNAPSGPLFFAVTASILWSHGRKPRTFLIAGVLLALLVHVSTIYILIIPFFSGLGAWLAWSQGRRWYYILLAVLWVSCGVLLCTAALILVNLAVGRSWTFFLPQIRYTAAMAIFTSRNVWWLPWSLSWVKSAAYLGFIFGGAAIAVSELVRIFFLSHRYSQPRYRNATVIHALYLLEVLIWTFLQTSMHITALQPWYMVYPLYGPLLLSIGAWLAPALGDVRPERLGAIALLFAVLQYVAITQSQIIIETARAVTTVSPFWPAALLVLLYMVLLTARAQVITIASAVLLLPISNALVVSSPSDYALGHCALNAKVYKYIVDTSVALSRMVKRPENVYVWFQEGERIETGCSQQITASDLGYSFTSIGHSYVDEPSPMKPIDLLSSDRLQAIRKEDAVIVAITADEDKAKLLASRFESEGVHLRYDGRILPPYGEHLVPFYLFRTVQLQ